MKIIKDYKKKTNSKQLKFSEYLKQIKYKVKSLKDLEEYSEYDFLSDDLQNLLYEKLKENNIKEVKDLKIYYSLSNSQGDGVGFYGEFEYKGINIKIIHYGNYYHYNSKNIYLLQEEFKTSKEEELFYNEFNELYINICKELEKEGYNYIDLENKYQQQQQNLNDLLDELNLNCDYYDFDLWMEEELKQHNKNIKDFVVVFEDVFYNSSNKLYYIKDFDIIINSYTQTTIKEFEEVVLK